MYIYMYIYIYIYIFIYVFIYVCVFIYVYICIFIYVFVCVDHYNLPFFGEAVELADATGANVAWATIDMTLRTVSTYAYPIYILSKAHHNQPKHCPQLA